MKQVLFNYLCLFLVDYVRRVKDPLDVWNDLKQMLPDADPIYLRNQARVLSVRPMEYYEEFLKNAIEKGDYPSMQDYLMWVLHHFICLGMFIILF
jgi:hypothetical protein